MAMSLPATTLTFQQPFLGSSGTGTIHHHHRGKAGKEAKRLQRLKCAGAAVRLASKPRSDWHEPGEASLSQPRRACVAPGVCCGPWAAGRARAWIQGVPGPIAATVRNTTRNGP